MGKYPVFCQQGAVDSFYLSKLKSVVIATSVSRVADKQKPESQRVENSAASLLCVFKTLLPSPQSELLLQPAVSYIDYSGVDEWKKGFN